MFYDSMFGMKNQFGGNFMYKEKIINIACFIEENSAVIRAVKSLENDIVKVIGCKVNINTFSNKDDVSKKIETTDIIIATKNVYELLPNETVLEKWEGYVVKKQDGKIFICGADKRGTIYGIYELSQYIGVSPWYYFADVPVKRKDELEIPDGFYLSDYPSVQYRGIFLNDEEELEEWAAHHTKDGTIGPELYEKIFELILRLKGNYIWPAMHVNYFQENPENARLANEMGIVVGTSHCDMLMRSNQNEWNPWLKKKGYHSDYNAVHSNKIDKDCNESEKENIFYDYSIPGKNRSVIQEYWRESIDMNRDYEVCYTVGMRGVHDFGFSTKMIDEDCSLSEEEKKTSRVKLLETIINDQRDMLKKELDLNSPDEALQSFIPYKEVLDLYDNGLKIPEDVTLIWVNDNFGHIRRYPNEKERERRGGHGLYYHASYWGTPDMSYLFFNSMPLAHITQELFKAYDSGIRKIWVLNVGALKPLEMDMETFLKYGWDAGKDAEIVNDIHAYTAHWFDKYFSGGFGEELACLYESFAQLTNARKVEHMTSFVFSQSGYGDEAGERLYKLEDVFNRANDIYDMLPNDEKEAFFQMFLFKVHASYYINHAFYYADRSIISYDRGNDRAADCYTDYSHTMIKYLRNMLRYYNQYMCDGKWDKILTPDSFPPPGICFYPVCKPSIKRKSGGLKLNMWDGDNAEDNRTITFCQNGTNRKWIELGNQGNEDISYTIHNKPQWLIISETGGKIITEKRIYISVSDLKECAGKTASFDIVNDKDDKKITVNVKVEEIKINIDDSVKISEADGAVCFFADDFDEKTETPEGAKWRCVYGIGRGYGNAMMAYNPKLESLDTNIIAENPCLKYSFIINSEGKFELEIIRFLTLDSRGKIRFAIGIDESEPIVVESETTDEWRSKWKESVLNNGEKISIILPELKAGIHTLKVYMIDNFITIHKMVIYTRNKRQTFFGFSHSHYLSDTPQVNWGKLGVIQESIYNARKNDVLPDIAYADKEFWKYNRIYMKNDTVEQPVLGEKRYEKYYSENEVSDITDMFGDGIFQERDGVLALETEYALENSPYAYLTPDVTGKVNWSHVRAETDGGTGLAMQVYENDITWNVPKEAPGMHYRIHISEDGDFNVWLLMLFEHNMSDTCYFAVDGTILPLKTQYRNGNLFNYSTAHIYFWCLTCNISFTRGEHTLSIYAGDSGMQIDRIYLSKTNEKPPIDAYWKCSERTL